MGVRSGDSAAQIDSHWSPVIKFLAQLHTVNLLSDHAFPVGDAANQTDLYWSYFCIPKKVKFFQAICVTK
jgi:hypothetical protein